jgi:hypothetical protein
MMAYSPTEAQASFLKATLWMIALSILLFWLPILGPVVAGLVGGYAAGSVGRAILASLMPAVALTVLVLLSAPPSICRSARSPMAQLAW